MQQSEQVTTRRGVGSLTRVDLREVWSNEAYDFTPWLENNIQELGDVIGLELQTDEREGRTENYFVDLVLQTDDGDLVVVENQLSRTDHDHLGKLVTYLAAYEANAAVWIAAEVSTEHVEAVNWLNETEQGDFYLVKLEAVKINDSEPAPLMTTIAEPSEEMRAIGTEKEGFSQRQKMFRRFWAGLLDIVADYTDLHQSISPRTGNWLPAGAGESGVSYYYVIIKNSSRVELYIDLGSEEENLRYFKALKEHRDEVEERSGEDLEWDNLPDKQACKIVNYLDTGGWSADEEEEWPEIQHRMAEAMADLENALQPAIEDLEELY